MFYYDIVPLEGLFHCSSYLKQLVFLCKLVNPRPVLWMECSSLVIGNKTNRNLNANKLKVKREKICPQSQGDQLAPVSWTEHSKVSQLQSWENMRPIQVNRLQSHEREYSTANRTTWMLISSRENSRRPVQISQFESCVREHSKPDQLQSHEGECERKHSKAGTLTG